MTKLWSEFTADVAESTGCRTQLIAPSLEVHVTNRKYLLEEFWPKWEGIKSIINFRVDGAPLQNDEVKGNCEEITKRFICELFVALRRTYNSRDISLSACEVSITIPPKTSVNGCMAPSDCSVCHRTVLMWLAEEDGTVNLYLVEPQNSYAQKRYTKVSDAVLAGVTFHECWL